MNTTPSFSLASPLSQKFTDVRLVTLCSKSSTAALHRFERWLRTVSGRIQRFDLSDFVDFVPGMTALPIACLPTSERQFINYQLDVARTYAFGPIDESSKSPGAALFHLRQIYSRVKSLVESTGCCRRCLANAGSPFRPTQNGCCQRQRQNTTACFGENQS